ncbi:hypothetical protein COOONC_24093 [Cooperia oncophora]
MVVLMLAKKAEVSLTSSLLNVVAGGSTVISSTVLNVTSSDREDYVVNVVEKPNYGWIVLDSWSTNNITSIDSFSGADLRERRVVYVSDRDSPATRDSFSVAVCISHHTCTQTQIVTSRSHSEMFKVCATIFALESRY